MNKKKGIIIFSKKIKENDLFIKILSDDDKIISSMVYGGCSSKKKSIFQLGYFIEYSLIKKNENNIPYLNAETTSPFIHKIINNKFKSYSLLTIISFINLSIVEGQKIYGIFNSVQKMVIILINQKHWLSNYCEWLFVLLKIIGYEIQYDNHKKFKYFDLNTNSFLNNSNKNTVIFPHDLFKHTGKVCFYEVRTIFEIFESIYLKNHLHNVNYKMPEIFINFKDTIFKELS